MTSIECVVEAQAELGESPVWSVPEGVLWWVDIDGRRVHRFDPATGSDESRVLARRPGSVGLTAQTGRLVMGIEHQFGVYDWETGAVSQLIDVAPENPSIRLNDGGTDRQGRYWIGSMFVPTSERRFDGLLYRVADDVSIERRGIGVANGIAFSPDGRTMYFADSAHRVVWAYDYEPDTGTRTNERVFVDFEAVGLPGKPDGATVDESECYWVACVHGGSVARFAPDGMLDRVIEVPCRRPTKPMFGGSDLRTMFLTSIGPRADGGPEDGRVYAIDAGVGGIAETQFSGSLLDA